VWYLSSAHNMPLLLTPDPSSPFSGLPRLNLGLPLSSSIGKFLVSCFYTASLDEVSYVRKWLRSVNCAKTLSSAGSAYPSFLISLRFHSLFIYTLL
jgi:hypothetical protein